MQVVADDALGMACIRVGRQAVLDDHHQVAADEVAAGGLHRARHTGAALDIDRGRRRRRWLAGSDQRLQLGHLALQLLQPGRRVGNGLLAAGHGSALRGLAGGQLGGRRGGHQRSLVAADESAALGADVAAYIAATGDVDMGLRAGAQVA